MPLAPLRPDTRHREPRHGSPQRPALRTDFTLHGPSRDEASSCRVHCRRELAGRRWHPSRCHRTCSATSLVVLVLDLVLVLVPVPVLAGVALEVEVEAVLEGVDVELPADAPDLLRVDLADDVRECGLVAR